MTRIRQTLLLWWRLWQEGRPAPVSKDSDGSESIPLKTLREMTVVEPARQIVNLLLWHAWQAGVTEWSLSAEGPSFDFQTIREAEARKLARHVHALAADDPLLTGGNLPAGFDPQAVRAWVDDVDCRSIARQAETAVVYSRCRSHLEALDLIADLQARVPRFWPRIQVRLWQMTTGADGHSRWFLPPRLATCHGRLTLLISGEPLTVHLTYRPAGIDLRMVPDSPAATASSSATTSA